MSHLTRHGRLVLAGVLAIALAACAAQPAATQKSLYERLGGGPAIEAVVKDFIRNVAADTRINRRFANANIPNLEKQLINQICEATGGPCKYTGKPMKESHKGMLITDAEFSALAEDLVKSLDKFKVPAAEKGELMAALAAMRKDIVGQ